MGRRLCKCGRYPVVVPERTDHARGLCQGCVDMLLDTQAEALEGRWDEEEGPWE